MKIYFTIIFCLLALYNVSGQIKNCDIKNNPNFSYYWDENQQSVALKGKVEDGKYRLFIDSILFAYVEIDNNKLNGGIIYFNSSDKIISSIGLIKNNKRYGTWIYFLGKDIYYVENISNETNRIKFGTDIEFLDKNWKLIKKLNYAEIVEIE